MDIPFINGYYDVCNREHQSSNVKLATILQLIKEDYPTELKHKVCRYISYQARDDKVTRITHDTIQAIGIPTGYFDWHDMDSFSFSIVDVKKFPFTITLRGAFPLNEVRELSHGEKIK